MPVEVIHLTGGKAWECACKVRDHRPGFGCECDSDLLPALPGILASPCAPNGDQSDDKTQQVPIAPRSRPPSAPAPSLSHHRNLPTSTDFQRKSAGESVDYDIVGEEEVVPGTDSDAMSVSTEESTAVRKIGMGKLGMGKKGPGVRRVDMKGMRWRKKKMKMGMT